jgi:hypothetical protein
MRLAPFLLCLLLGASARAQTSSASDAPLQASPLPELEVGEDLRVVRQEGPLEGRLLESSASSLTLALAVSGRERAQVPVSEVLEISVRKRSPGYGALIGTGAGALGGALFGLDSCGYFSRFPFEQCALSGAAGGIGGALLGAGVGALVGIFVQRWDSVYERAPTAEAR